METFVDGFLQIPWEGRLCLAFLWGLACGAFANWGIYRFAWQPRLISPWSGRTPPGMPSRPWWSRIPLVGWWGLRQESPVHGKAFWVRPMLIELALGTLFAALYVFEIRGWEEKWWTIVPLLRVVEPVPAGHPSPLVIAHVQFFSQTVLITLLSVASFIDVDERYIPDQITIPGTLLGLLFAAFYPWSLLPAGGIDPDTDQAVIDFLRCTSTLPISEVFPGFEHPPGLAVGVLIFVGWCFALSPRVWKTRRGFSVAARIFVARLLRDPFTWFMAILAVCGSVAIGLAWWRGGFMWEGLFTSLVGMLGGGGLIWMIRLIGAAVLRKEAMGFGDVTLMAMIGAFLGWQASLAVFFLSPFAALLVCAVQWLLHRENEIYFGPFLSLAALFVIFRWGSMWMQLWPVFSIPWLVPVALLVCFVLMAVLLGAFRLAAKARGSR